MSESSPEPSEQVSSSLDGIDTKKLLAGAAAAGALGLSALIYEIARRKLRGSTSTDTEQTDEDL